MRHKFWFAGRTYFQKIMFFMSLFSLILFIPFTMITYKLSENSTLKSINASNDSVLSQINYTYKYLTNSMSNICMEIFFKNGVRNIMYNRDIPYNEVLSALREIEDTTLLANPSIYSISIFNKIRNEMYTTKMNRQTSEQELMSFIDEQESIQKLKPILRTMTTHTGNIETTSYVFSYFMYEFDDPATHSSSFLVVNQNANWFMDNIVNNTYSSNTFSSSTYLLDKNGEICKGINSTIEQEAHKYLIENYKADILTNNKADPQHNIKKYKGKKYIVSSVKLGDSDNSLLIIQDYNEVFKNHIELKNNFIIVSICFLFIMIISLFLFSLKIYTPVNNLMSNLTQIKGLSRGNSELKKLNEFEYLQDMYLNVNESNNRLQNEAASFLPIAEHYQLFMLANDSNISSVEQFKSVMPDHWLSKIEECKLCVLIFQIDSFEHNNNNFEQSDMELLLFSVQNIADEIICANKKYSSFKNTKNTFTLIIDLSASDVTTEVDSNITQKLHQAIEKTQQLTKQHLDITVSVAYSSIGHSGADISILFSEAKEYMSYRYIFGAQSILNKDKCSLNSGNVQTTYSQKLDDMLMEAIKKDDMEKIRVILTDIKNELCTFKSNSVTICQMAMINLVNKTIDEKNNQKVNFARNYEDIYQKAIDSEYIDNFFSELIKYIRQSLSSEILNTTESKDQIFVSSIMIYVQKNYQDIDLSSASIADYLGMSSKYVMRKFKECTNISLNDYIIGFRMKKAASLLENTHLPISKIADEIGIENETYFYKLFKKTYDCTPREYTEMNCK